jgi:RNA polymerase sigma-70 factor, ECF subfamily
MNHADLFLQYRSLLFGIAYRMLGSLDAEDILQDAFLQFQKLDLVAIANPRGLLITIVTRRCLDWLKSARVQREQYVGTWLPEPLSTEDLLETIAQKETLSMAFMLMLETLTPVERAVFLLRDVFDLDYAEIADTIDKSPQNCRQIAHRARINLNLKQTRCEIPMEQKAQLLQEFLAACNGQDLNGLMELLAADCKFYSDGGGKAIAALKPILGRDRVMSFLFNVMKQLPQDLQTTAIEVNGEPGVLLQTGDQIVQTLSMRVREGKITELYAIRNPDKLDRFAQVVSSTTQS